jgi:hypothetical protein
LCEITKIIFCKKVLKGKLTSYDKAKDFLRGSFMKVSWLIGRAIQSSDKKKHGYVLAVCVANGNVVSLLCADEHEKEFVVDVKDITAFAESLVFEDRTALLRQAKPVQLGKQSYNANGQYLGVLTDYEWENGTLASAIIDGKPYAPNLVKVGDIALVECAEKNIPAESCCHRRGRKKAVKPTETCGAYNPAVNSEIKQAEVPTDLSLPPQIEQALNEE